MLYEGTIGFQAFNLLGRKVLCSEGKLMVPFANEIAAFCESHAAHPMARKILMQLQRLQILTEKIADAVAGNADELGASSVDYLMYTGYLILGYFWAKTAIRAHELLGNGGSDSTFYTVKIETTEFYFEHILPRSETLVVTIESLRRCQTPLNCSWMIICPLLRRLNNEHFRMQIQSVVVIPCGQDRGSEVWLARRKIKNLQDL